MMIYTRYLSAITVAVRSALVAIALPAIAGLWATPAQAMSTDNYAASSRLASGRWVKISVPESGVYALRAATLRQMGFSNPAAVRVYGYGGTVIPETLTANNYIDDLPMAPMTIGDDGSIVFYAVGPESWTVTAQGYQVGKLNIYSNLAYYFVSDTAEDIPAITETGGDTDNDAPEDTFMERVHHEQDIATPGEAGGQLVGEDFRFKPTNSFTVPMPGRVEGTDVWMQTSFVARTLSASSQLQFTVNGSQLEQISTDVIPATANDSHYHGTEGVTSHTLKDISGNSMNVEIRHVASGTVYGAWLNYLAVNYRRRLSLENDKSGALLFTTSSTNLALAYKGTAPTIWDVTDAATVRAVRHSDDNGTARWRSDFGGRRTYVAWGSSATLPVPTVEGVVANQDLHAETTVDMVIITPKNWADQARRIADMHTAESLKVRIADPEQIYNEFSSGRQDVSGLRKYLKMLYDRSADSTAHLRYVLLMARATYDNRHNTPDMKLAAPTLPAWFTTTVRETLNDTDGYGTDDFIGMLEDYTGANKGSDKISVAVGRIPVTSVNEARQYVDKLLQYNEYRTMTGWENQAMMLADDEDSGDHMRQTEKMVANMDNIPGQPLIVNKVYIDAYERRNGNYPEARQDMFSLLNDGVVWWNYVGHANNHSMTHDGQLTYNDINNMFLKRVPVLFAATCDFLRWDSNTLSGGEILMHERYGGTIATISATRPVWIYENGLYVAAMGRWLGARDANGELLRLGDIYTRAKNDIRDDKGNLVNSTNRLRFVLMGDPAMRLATPSMRVRLDSINGTPPGIDGDNPPVVAGLRQNTFSGSILGADSQLQTDFNGTVTLTVYDAETTVTTNGYGDSGIELPVDKHGGKLFAGSAKVTAGRFDAKVILPAEIADNFRPAMVNMYATADADSTGNLCRAIGVERGFYVYGTDETAEADTVPPVISEMYLNTRQFANGGTVNDSPMLIAQISDDRALNLSEAGLTGRITAILDGSTRYSNVAGYFTPAQDGSASGTINYPLSDLRPGNHTLTLRVRDAANNIAERTIDFNVVQGLPVKTFDIYCTPNPAETEAKFYVVHDRPDQLITVTVTVCNLLGHTLWTGSVTGVSDMVKSTPVTWNLCDSAGRRVQRGIYIYRVTVGVPGEGTHDSGARRLAVTGE